MTRDGRRPAASTFQRDILVDKLNCGVQNQQRHFKVLGIQMPVIVDRNPVHPLLKKRAQYQS
jgi:hypothetical protein